MEMQQYVEILQRRKWVILLTTIMTVAVVGVGSYLTTPIYSASTVVRIAQIQDLSVGYFDLNYSVRLMNTYEHVLKSRPFLEEVVQRLDINILRLDPNVLPKDLAKRIKVEVLADTELLKITVESTNPRQAMEIANTLATLLIEEGQKLYAGQGKGAREILQEQLTIVEENLTKDRARFQSLLKADSGQDQAGTIQDLNARIRIQEQTYAMLLNEYDQARVAEAMRANSISVVEPAITPMAPSKPRLKLNIALGGLVGLVGGMGLAFLFENLDPAMHSADSLEAVAKVPLLGWIPRFSIPRGSRQGAILLDGDELSPVPEAFRILRSNILALAPGRPLKTLLIASAERGAGKSMVLANLAAAIAQAGRKKVIVVDSDLRNPCLHQVFDVPNERGLSNVVLDMNRVDTALQETKIPGLRVLPSGGPFPPNSGELLDFLNMQKLIKKLAEETDMVLLDSPPILAVADAAMLAPMVDGVLVIAAQDQATAKGIRRALQQLDKVGARVLGIVFNKAKA